MAKHHTPNERAKLFGMGFRRGAGMKAIPDDPPGLKEDCDFNNGYREGRHAYARAMEIAREHFGAPPLSMLRVAQEDLERQEDLKMFEAIEMVANVDLNKVRIGAQEFALPCTCHLMDGGKKCAGCLAEMEKLFDA